MQLTTCPDCRGTGRRRGAAVLSTCPLCEGKGQIPTERKRWIDDGRAARDKRTAAGLTPRDVGRTLGITAATVREMEAGRVNPAPLAAIPSEAEEKS